MEGEAAGSTLEERVTRLERDLTVAQNLIARLVVTTMVASYAIRDAGSEIAAESSHGVARDRIVQSLRLLEDQADLLDRALEEASRAER